MPIILKKHYAKYIKSVPLKTKKLQSDKVNVTISTDVTDQLCQIKTALHENIGQLIKSH